MIKKIFHSEFNRNVTTLFTGTTISQVIPIMLAPILTRIYGPEEYGVFALYTAIVAILSILSTGRYELAIIIPQKDKDAINVAGVAMFANICISIFLFLIFLIGGEKIKRTFGFDELGIWIYFIPFSLIVLGLYQTIYSWFNRRKMYKEMSRNKVIQQFGIGISNLSLGYTTNGIGLVFGTIIGQMISVSLITKKIFKQEENIIKKIQIKQMVIQAKKYKDFPKYLTLAHTLNTTSRNLPTILFTTFFSAVSVGYFSLTQRMIQLPLSLIGSAISDVFRQKALEDITEKGNCKQLYKKTFVSLFLLGIIPFTTMYIISPRLFSIIFGAEWGVAGEYARLMIPMFFLQFIISPLSVLFVIMEKQKMDLYFQVLLFILIIGALIIGFFVYNSIEVSISLFSLAYSIVYIINGVITYRLASKEQ